jgi:beta-N-acetylhexosaminidase
VRGSAIPPSIAAAAVVGAALVTIGIIDSGERHRTPLARLVGARVMARMDGAAATPALLARARGGRIGGVILFPNGADGAALSAAIRRLQVAAKQGGGPGLLVAIDQEGGEVKRLPGRPPNRPPSRMASARDARREGAATGRYLARLGVNVDLAPVMDVPSGPGAFVASRTFGSDASRVAALGTAFADGLADAGVAGTAKHFPGLGSATVNTDLHRSVISASAAALRTQLEPFRRAIDSHIPLVMLSTAVYSAYDGSTPAALSQRVVRDRLRRELGFDGVAITDDLDSPAIRAVTTPARAAVASARAGGDIALFARTGGASYAGYSALLAAARSGALKRAQLEDSYDRIAALVSRLEPE